MTDSLIGRRALLRGAVGLATAAAASSLVACGTGTSRGGDGATKTVLVRNSGGAYGDALQKGLYEPFTKETGIAVQPVNVQYAQMMAQIQQGRPQFDVIDNSMFAYVKMARDNAIEELDYDRLPNSKGAGIAENLLATHALGKNYWGSVLAYRTDAFGGRKPTGWADVWDATAFPGNRSLQNPDADLPELEFALLADGVPMESLYPLDVDRAFAALDRIKPSVLKYWDTGNLPGVLLSRQEVVISTVWHGRLDELIGQGVPLAYEFSGARRQSNGWAIPKGAANVDTAYQLIDFSMRPDVQAGMARIYPNAPVVPAAFDQLSEAEAARLIAAPDRLASGFDLNVDWWLENEDAVTNRWLEWSRV